VEALTKCTSMKDPALYDKTIMLRLPTSGELQTDRLQHAPDWFVQGRAVPEAPDLTKLVDTQFTRHASEVPGP
jgi:hypothetical protein